MTEDLKLTVVPLYDKAIASDIAGSLRRAADSVAAETEEDNRTVALVTVQVCENGEIKVYGWGRTDRFHAMGVLAAGLADLA